jgi:hypothetical protein
MRTYWEYSCKFAPSSKDGVVVVQIRDELPTIVGQELDNGINKPKESRLAYMYRPPKTWMNLTKATSTQA